MKTTWGVRRIDAYELYCNKCRRVLMTEHECDEPYAQFCRDTDSLEAFAVGDGWLLGVCPECQAKED